MFSEDGTLQWAAQYRTWGGVRKIWQAENDNTVRGPYPPVARGALAIKYETAAERAAQDCPIRFQGQYEDAETGLYYNRYRYYDPLVGQYLSPDPLGLGGGTRPNGYVHNPNQWIDPLGLAPKQKPGPKLSDDVAKTFTDGIYTNRQLLKDETLYKYHGENNRTGRKISWLTNKKYSSQEQLRQDLAIRHDWGVNITKVSEFRIPKGTWLSEGTAAPQGVGYPGGGYQAVVTNLPKVWVVKTVKVPW